MFATSDQACSANRDAVIWAAENGLKLFVAVGMEVGALLRKAKFTVTSEPSSCPPSHEAPVLVNAAAASLGGSDGLPFSPLAAP